MLRSVIQITRLHSADATTPSVKQSAKSLWTPFGEPIFKRWFLRVQDNNVGSCLSGQGNMASRTQRERIGIERNTERAHLQEYD